jgi:hypothetical protein
MKLQKIRIDISRRIHEETSPDKHTGYNEASIRRVKYIHSLYNKPIHTNKTIKKPYGCGHPCCRRETLERSNKSKNIVMFKHFYDEYRLGLHDTDDDDDYDDTNDHTI